MCAHTYTSMHTHLIVSENNYAEKKLYQHGLYAETHRQLTII